MTKNTQPTRTTLQENIELFESVIGRKMTDGEVIIFSTGYNYATLDSHPVTTLPDMLSSSQVAAMIGIDRTNMPYQRKRKGFPQPIATIDRFPLYLKSDIVAWMEAKEQ